MLKKIILINDLKINNDIINKNKKVLVYTEKCLNYIKKFNLDIICDICKGTGWTLSLIKKDYIICKKCKGIGKLNN